MDVKLCPFCHTWCSSNVFQAHLDAHMQKLQDGQMKDHVTVPPEQRFAGDISKEPKSYVHPKCGGVTGMPEEIIRSYVMDPFLYNESSFCTGCHTYVPIGELYWQESSESLLAASYQRRAEFIQKNYLNPNDFVWDSSGPVRRKSRGGSGAGVVAVFAIGGVAAFCLLGVVFVVGLLSFRAAPRRPAALPMNAGKPGFPPAFEPAKFPDFPQVEIPKGRDIDQIIRESNERMAKQLDESQKRHEKFMEEARSQALAPPGALGGPPAGLGGIEEARQRSEESRKRTQERIDAMRGRMKKNRP